MRAAAAIASLPAHLYESSRRLRFSASLDAKAKAHFIDNGLCGSSRMRVHWWLADIRA